MANNHIRISVVTVSYNAVATIEETMLSVLNQTYDNIEYIIIDGGSTDGTVDIIKKYSGRLAYWKSEPDNGIYDAMNKGIVVATGDYINFMNAGDMFASKDIVTEVVNNIEYSAYPAIIYGDTIFQFDYGYLRFPALPVRYIKKKIPYCHQSSFVKTEVHKRRPFNLSFKICADYNFCYSVCYHDHLNIVHIPLTITIFEASHGLSSKSTQLSFNEKCRIWNPENNKLKRFFYKLLWFVVSLKLWLHKILPNKLVMSVQKQRIKLRNNNISVP